MEQKHSHVRSHYLEMNRWMQFLNLRHDMDLSCMLVAVTARPGFISYQNSFEELPLLIHRYYSHTSVMLLFPDQWGEPQESISVFTPNGTAVQRQPRSLGGLIRRWLFTSRRSALILLALLLPFLAEAQRPRFDKMSPMVRYETLNELKVQDSSSKSTRQKSVPQTAERGRSLLVLVLSTSEDVLHQHGCHIYSHWGNIYAASVPKRELAALSLRKEVTRIESGRVCDAQTDTSAIITRSDLLRTATPYRPSYTGKGVIVGVMDIGFDLTNPSFYSRDLSSYRVRSFWDMLDFDGQETGSDEEEATGDGQQTADGGQLTSVYGMELPVGKAFISEETILQKACSSDSKLQYHGTHTASTAAGSGYDKPYIGMAPDADLCLVNNAVTDDKPLVPDSIWDFFGPVADLLGFEYIFRYADEANKPCVINFSEGSHEDLWGEAQLYSIVLDSLVRPGRLICSSAGNQSNFGTYMQKPKGKERSAALIQPSSTTTYMMLRSRGSFDIQLDFFSSPQEAALNYVMPIEEVLADEDSLLVDTVTAGNLTYELTFGCYPSCYDSSQLVTDVVITKIGKGSVLSVQTAIGVAGEEAEVEVFQEIGYLTTLPYYHDYMDVEYTHNINFPGSDPSVICVGATSYRTGFFNYAGNWQNINRGSEGVVATYSSRGPTLAGHIKPEVVAPGTNVIAAFNSFYREEHPANHMTSSDVDSSTFNGREYTWSSQSGTSMSCPIVVGIIAQWMEAFPKLTRKQVVEAFAASCNRHDPTLAYPNNDYGYGEIDAEAGLKYLMEHSDRIENVDQSILKNGQAIYNLAGQRLSEPRRGINIIGGKKVVKW